jgi:hypothetical protein
VFSCGTIGNGGGNNDDEADDVLPVLPTGAIAATFVSVNRETVLLLLLFVDAICCCCFGVAAASVPAVAFAVVVVVVVVCCGVVAVDDTAVVFAADDVSFDISGFNVFGIPHIFDSVVLTGLSFDSGLLGSHIAAICSVDNIVLRPLADSAGDGDDGWVVDAEGGDDGEDECCA